MWRNRPHAGGDNIQKPRGMRLLRVLLGYAISIGSRNNKGGPRNLS
jgi:hypothetical protein